MVLIKKFSLFPVILFASVYVNAQRCNFNPGTKTLYVYSGTAKPVTPPGFAPVFINHVGRHGARHLTKEVGGSFAYNLIAKADSLTLLSGKGKRLKQIIIELDKIEKGNVKSISLQGQSEQEGIAKRMFEQNKKVFQSSQVRLKVMITKEIRTKQTADAFLKQVKNILPGFAATNYAVNDTILRFYDLAPAYLKFEKEESWKKEMQQLKSKLDYNNACTQVADQFFDEGYGKKLSSDEKENFVSDIFGFIAILPSIQQEIKNNNSWLIADSLTQFFSCGQLSVLSKIANAEDYLLKGPGKSINGIQVTIAAPLLADFITSTDEFLQNKKGDIDLRFTHAEAIAPFAALLGMEGAASVAKDIFSFDKAWKAEKVIPLSANIQWIVYKNSSNKYFIKFLLNEKEAHIKGLSTKTFPCYQWKNVRSFYLDKLKQLGITPRDNMHQFLLNLN